MSNIVYEYRTGVCAIDSPCKDQTVSVKKQAIDASNKTPKTKNPTPLIPVQPTKPRYMGANHSHYESSVTDKRVYLNVSPLAKNNEEYLDRIRYVLGSEKRAYNGSNIYGFLYKCLKPTVGIVFPYTPRISINHQVNYERTEIIHSNLAVSHYKNTPPPTYSIDAVFTADSKEMARHMLSAIWFMRAVTKCDFGEAANSRNGKVDGMSTAGMPPPILYLNGWNNLLDNIPVVVKSFSYTLPDDQDYVGLGLNLNLASFENINQLYSDAITGDFYDTGYGDKINMNNTSETRYINGIPVNTSNITTNPTTIGVNKNDRFYLKNWLPVELQMHIELEVQPNLQKYKKRFDLDYYKMGVMYLDSYKGGQTILVPDQNGCFLRVAKDATTGEILSSETRRTSLQAIQKEMNENPNVTASDEVKSGFSIMPTKYTFDRAGWTW